MLRQATPQRLESRLVRSILLHLGGAAICNAFCETARSYELDERRITAAGECTDCFAKAPLAVNDIVADEPSEEAEASVANTTALDLPGACTQLRLEFSAATSQKLTACGDVIDECCILWICLSARRDEDALEPGTDDRK